MITEPGFSYFLRLARAAGLHGMPMPGVVHPAQLSPDQLKQANLAYEEARNVHRAQTLKGRAK